MRLSLPILLLGACVLASSETHSQEMEVPVAIQIPIFLKVITFDRLRKARAPSELVIGIAYQHGYRTSVTARDEALLSIANARDSSSAAPIRVETIDLDDERLADALKRAPITLLYITPLRATDITLLAATARAARVTTVTGVPRYVVNGLAVGVELRDRRPRILVNLEASRLEGADLTSELLKLATIVR
ncbi:MAG: hypothetical protein JWM95_5085 [Gemmatimonadetes bacterium]|nr:hypothetical protein [Gemmatimonadota bacterium]